jgi:hypothetical protein
MKTATPLRRPPGYRRRQATGYARGLVRPARMRLADLRYRHHLRALASTASPNARARRLHQMALLAGQISGWERREPHTQAWWLAMTLLEAIAATEAGHVLADGGGLLTGAWADPADRAPEDACVTALLTEHHDSWVAMTRADHLQPGGRAERARLLRAMHLKFLDVPGIDVLDDIAATEHAGAPW